MNPVIWVVREGELQGYQRLGHCLACGECCSRFSYKYQAAQSAKQCKEGEESADLSKYEGWAVEDWDDEKQWRWWGLPEITQREKLCDCFDQEKKFCSHFGKETQIEICRKFPFRPEDLQGLENCGFHFEQI